MSFMEGLNSDSTLWLIRGVKDGTWHLSPYFHQLFQQQDHTHFTIR